MGIAIIFVVVGLIIIIASVAKQNTKQRERQSREDAWRREQEQKRAKMREIATGITNDFNNVGWTGWGPDIHLQNDQIGRMMRTAKSKSMTLIQYDANTRTAYVQGEHEEVYKITKRGCSCRDFAYRGLPCKHMYFAVSEIVGDE